MDILQVIRIQIFKQCFEFLFFLLEEAVLQKKKFLGFWFFLFALLFLTFSTAQAQKQSPLIGRETLNFTLPSTHDRIINYAEGYYGKHPLITLFFPAAYTPV